MFDFGLTRTQVLSLCPNTFPAANHGFVRTPLRALYLQFDYGLQYMRENIRQPGIRQALQCLPEEEGPGRRVGCIAGGKACSGCKEG